MTLGIATTRAQSYLETLRGTAYAGITTPFVQLHTNVGEPGAAGTANISAGSTTRNAITWNAFSAGQITLATLGAWTNGGASETIGYVSVWTASTAGVFVQSFALTTAQAWVSGNTLTLTTFSVNATPIAT